MLDILRILYLGIAGIEIGFLITLSFYRFVSFRQTANIGFLGLACLALSFILFLLGASGVIYEAGDGWSWIFATFSLALVILIAGTYFVNISDMGVHEFFMKHVKRN